MAAEREYSYTASLKSDVSDELLNTYLLRPIADLVVRLLYNTPATPNQVTIASIVAGIVAAGLYAVGAPGATAAAGLCVTLKDILDSADGQLARAKQMYTRRGRFLDSLGDLLVNVLVFGAFSYSLYRSTGSPLMLLGGVFALLGISLRVSYHVFYQTSFMRLQGLYGVNRTTEEVQGQDLEGDPTALRLQQWFLFFYGWQDALMLRIDRWSRKGVQDTEEAAWYTDPPALRLSGFIGLGTELFVLMFFSLFNRLDIYIGMNVLGFNILWAICLFYRKGILAPALRRRSNPAEG